MKTYTHDELRTLASAHALDALDADDAAAIQRHLATCAECRGVFDDALEAAAMIAISAPGARPPAALKDRILAAARAEGQPARVVDIAAVRSRRAGLLTPARLTAAAFAAAAAVAAVVAVSARSDADRLRSQRDALAAAAGSLAGQEGRVLALRNGAEATDASIVVPQSGDAVLVSQLATAPAAHVYQVWAIPPGGAPVSIGTIGGGATALRLSRDLTAGTTIAITVEPGGGSRSPTTKPIGAAKVS